MSSQRGDAERLLDEAPGGYLVTTLDGQVRWTNSTFARWIGRSSSELVGSSIHDLLTPGGSIHYESIAPALTLRRGNVVEVALDVRRSDGSTLRLLCNARSDSDDSAPAGDVHWTCLDVTGRLSHERDLLVTQRRLRRLQALAGELASSLTVDDIGDALMAQLVDGIKADDGVVFLLDGDGLPHVVTSRSVRAAIETTDLEFDPQLEQAVAEQRAVFVTEPPCEAEPDAVGRQVAALPLIAGGRVIGAVRLRAERKKPHNTEERDLLIAAAEMCSPVLDRVQITDRHRREAERNAALSRLLHDLEGVTTVADRAQLITDFLVPTHADYATVEIPSMGREPVGLRHHDPAQEPTLRRLRTDAAITKDQPHSLSAGRETRSLQLIRSIDEAMYLDYGLDPEKLAALQSLAPRSYLGLPLVARGHVIGSLMLVQSSSDRRFDDDDVAFHQRVADACALSLENARLYEHERDVANQLQQALLSQDLPTDPRVSIDSFYEAGQELTQVGGDWYDAFPVADDRLGFVVGDIVGGGIAAATAMSQVRTALKAYAVEGLGVAGTLDELNRFVHTVPGALGSSVAYAEFDLASGTLTYGCAGHPPPALVTPGRSPELLWAGRGALLGVGSEPQQQSEIAVGSGAMLVLFTDGLVERRGQAIDQGLQELLAALSALGPGASPHALAERMSTGAHGDDICVLAVTAIAG